MPDSFFTSSPHWGAYIALYFFVGGVAGGCCALAGLLQLCGGPADRPVARTGYFVAFAGALLSGLLLTLDLTRPLRFWHMLIDPTSGRPVLKLWSPMSVGAWGLVAFGAVAALGALGALGELRPAWRRAAALAKGAPGALIAVLGCGLGLFVAGYTGVLLAVSNRPIWADSSWLGVLFLCSGVSTAAATLVLLAGRSGAAPGTVDRLVGYDRKVLALELLVLAGFLGSLGGVARAWIGWPGLGLLLGVAGAGIIAPLALERRALRQGQRDRAGGRHPAVLAAALVLLGGLLLRVVVIAASAQIQFQASRSAGP